MRPKHIIISDFDYTLFEHGRPQETAENLQAIKRWRKDGNLFVIATGRGIVSLSLELPNYREYADFFILNDGATIITPHNEPIHNDHLSKQLVDSFTKNLESCNLASDIAIVSYYGNKELDYIKPECYKFRIWCKELQDSLMIEKMIEDSFPRRLSYIAYHDVDFNHDVRLGWVDEAMLHTIEVNLAGTSKKSAAKTLLERLNIRNTSHNVIAIGDDRNDLSLLEAYDGYAVERANAAVLERIPTSRIVPHLSNLIAEKRRALA